MIASVVGAICFIVILIGIICCCRHRRYKKNLTQSQQSAAQNASHYAAAPASVTYTAFQPAVGYQGPYQSAPQMYPNDVPPPYSAYDSTVVKPQGYYQTSGQAPVVVDNCKFEYYWLLNNILFQVFLVR